MCTCVAVTSVWSSHAYLTIQFSSSFAITMMFPFAPFLVSFLLPQIKETDVGKQLTNVHQMCFGIVTEWLKLWQSHEAGQGLGFG